MKKKKFFGDVPIGGTFEYKGIVYRVVENNDRSPKFCEGCAFDFLRKECLYLYCVSGERTDRKDVKFVRNEIGKG